MPWTFLEIVVSFMAFRKDLSGSPCKKIYVVLWKLFLAMSHGSIQTNWNIAIQFNIVGWPCICSISLSGFSFLSNHSSRNRSVSYDDKFKKLFCNVVYVMSEAEKLLLTNTTKNCCCWSQATTLSLCVLSFTIPPTVFWSPLPFDVTFYDELI